MTQAYVVELQESPSQPLDLLQLQQTNPTRFPMLLETVAAPLNMVGSANADEQSSVDLLFVADQSVSFDAIATKPIPVECSTSLPFTGGWVAYLPYEYAAEVEPTLPFKAAQPKAWRCRAAFCRDHASGKLLLVHEGLEAVELQTLCAAARDAALARTATTAVTIGDVSQPDGEHYQQAVKRAQRYIYDGDVFQANIAHAWTAPLAHDTRTATTLYQQLRQTNPAPFAGLLFTPDETIISSSPERLIRCFWRDGKRWVDTRPIAGTRKRDENDSVSIDQQTRDELVGNPKERAEHIMLIDLERNDLGRICTPGTVNVNELMSLETYKHVHHIVSNVEGQLRDDVRPAEAVKAVFPGGTITGCPKVRCMEIIHELETRPRGAYTGSMGYINRDGTMDFNILIRTVVMQNDEISIHAGAGIVHDSVPEKELRETYAKAKGMLLALDPEVDC